MQPATGMKRRVVIAVLALFLIGSPMVWAATAKPGATCTKSGAKTSTAGRTLVCKKSGKRLTWQLASKVSKPKVVSDPVNSYPPVIGPEPSQKVMAFYYAWYETPEFDGRYFEWDNERLKTSMPDDITSDYMPELGVYSSSDPAVIAQHMAWLRRAGIGVAVVSFHRSRPLNSQIAMYLDMAQRYGIKIAFMMEPATGRTATTLVSDVKRLIYSFGTHPAFFKTSARSPWLTNSDEKPLFFVWAIHAPELSDPWVGPEYWTEAIDTIHRESNALMIGTSSTAGYDGAVNRAHFDGAFNYITIDLAREGGFNWAGTLPKGALYIPSVAPGNYAVRIQYPPESTLLRNDGATYDDQWRAALSTGTQPDFVTITSFNEWHEGSQIEPPRAAFTTASGRQYIDFGSVGPYFYLDATAKWVKTFTSNSYGTPTSHDIRVTITSTSEWAGLQVSSGQLVHPSLIDVSGPGITCRFNGVELFVERTMEAAMTGSTASCTWVVSSVLDRVEVFGESGSIGSASVKVSQPMGSDWRLADEWSWASNNMPRTRYTFSRGASS